MQKHNQSAPSGTLSVRVYARVFVCVFVVRLAVNADEILSIWLKPSHAADFVC